MVTSSAQLSGAANSSVDHPGVHQPSRSLHQVQGGRHESPNRSSAVPRPTPSQADQHQHPPSSGPSVVSRYVLPTYRQANSSSAASPMSHHANTSSNPAIHPLNASLPDILHSHMVPQIPRLRQNQRRHGGGGGDHRHNRERHRSEGDGTRHRHARHVSRGERRTQSSSSHSHESCSCKDPCVKCVVTVTSFRWVLVVLSILGVCCVVSGIVLAALHAAGSSFLFLAVMFIGLGILLVIVVSVGWKCTPRGHEPLHALFHIGQFGRGGSRERHRRRRHRHRDGNWFGGVFYPEFQYRRPPPSYNASMQEYQNQSLQELSNPHPPASSSRHERTDSLPGSPPPSYHSRTSTIHSGMNITIQGDSLPNSRPPTYRSRAPSRRPSLPRHDSPHQQGVETVSDPSLPTTSVDEFLHSGLVGESIRADPSVAGGDGGVAHTTAIDMTFTAPTTVSSMHGLDSTPQPTGAGESEGASTSPSVSSPHADTDTHTTPIHHHVNLQLDPSSSSVSSQSQSQGAYHENNNFVIPTSDSNQNDPPSVIDISSSSPSLSSNSERDSTIVVITNQPTTPTVSSSIATPSSSSSSFIISSSLPRSPRTIPPPPPSDSDNFQSDVQRLEEALEPLDGMDELEAGIDNLGANISTESTEHYDTHL